MKPVPVGLAWLHITLILSGCQLQGAAVPPVAAQEGSLSWITDVGSWPEPAEYRVQLVTFTDQHNTSHRVRYDVSLTAERLVMAAQTTLGLPLYESILADGQLRIQRHVEQLAGVEVERAVADFVLATWPVRQLAAALEEAGYTIQASGSQRRLLNEAGELQVHILGVPTDTGRSLQIIHHDIPLRIDIQTLRRDPIDP